MMNQGGDHALHKSTGFSFLTDRYRQQRCPFKPHWRPSSPPGREKKLRSKDFTGTVAGELAKLFNRLDSGQIGTGAFQSLVLAVTRRASDVEIWKQVLLITSTSRITSPPSIGASFGAIPRTYNSASHEGSEQTERLLHDALRDELRGCSYVKVQGFFENYFEDKSWSQKGKEIYDSVKHMHMGDRWATYPDVPTKGAVWEWWSRLQDEHLINHHKTETICLTSYSITQC